MDEEYRNRKYVIIAIKKLRSATTLEITNQINEDIKHYNNNLEKRIESEYGYNDKILSPGDKKKYFNKERRKYIALRTVQRAVRALNRLGILYKRGKQYSLSPNASKEMRYFSDDFAIPAVSSVTWFPIKTVEQSLEELIVRYGVFIAFVFIEATRSIITKQPADNIDKKKLFNSWLHNALPIREMFDFFFKLYRGKDNSSDTELSEKTIEKLTRILDRKYPEIYKQLVESKLATIDEKKSVIEDKMSQLEIEKSIRLSTKRIKPGESRRVYIGRSTLTFTFNPPVPKDWYSQLEAE